MSEVAKSWARITRWFARSGIELALGPPATAESVRRLEQAIGRELPSDFVESLSMFDGQRASGVSWLGGRLGAVDDLLAEYQRNHSGQRDEDVFELFNTERVRAVVFDTGRVPLSGMPYWTGDSVFFDFVPGPAGVMGQVIKLVSECDFVVLGESWAEVLERYASLAEAGELEWHPELHTVRFEWERFRAG
ncbi:MAG: SMI1/KNR4 family protein [Myxococcaceae bacterium]